MSIILAQCTTISLLGTTSNFKQDIDIYCLKSAFPQSIFAHDLKIKMITNSASMKLSPKFMCMHVQDNVSYQQKKIATIFANQFHVFLSD